MIGKIISLPSSGISYSKFIRVFPIKFGSMLLMDKAFYNSNQSEYIEALLNEYTKGLDILEMYVGDAIYVYNYISATSMELEKFATKKICPHCEEVNLIKIDINSFDIKFLRDDAPEICSVELSAGKVFFRRRKMKDNFVTAIELIKKETVKEMDYLIEFMIPQIVGFTNSTKTYDFSKPGGLEEAREFITTLPLAGKKVIYEAMEKHEHEFGYENKFEMTCRSCEKPSQFNMWDYKHFSVFFPARDEDKSSQFADVINLVRSKTIRFEEFLNVPNLLVKDVIDGIQKSIGDKQGG